MSLYFLPLAFHWGPEHMRHGAPLLSYTLAKARRGAQLGAVIDGAFDDGFAIDLATAIRAETPLEMEGGAVAFDASDSLKDMPPPGSAPSQIGRASWRERGCQYVSISVGA